MRHPRGVRHGVARSLPHAWTWARERTVPAAACRAATAHSVVTLTFLMYLSVNESQPWHLVRVVHARHGQDSTTRTACGRCLGVQHGPNNTRAIKGKTLARIRRRSDGDVVLDAKDLMGLRAALHCIVLGSRGGTWILAGRSPAGRQAPPTPVLGGTDAGSECRPLP